MNAREWLGLQPTHNPTRWYLPVVPGISTGGGFLFGGCGLGALDEAKARGLWGIGVDSDQLYLGPEMLTSALKDVAKSVYLTSQEFKKSPANFKTGFNKVFNVKNGGIGYGKVSAKLKNRAAIIKKVNAIKKLIAAGKIVPPAK